MVCGVCETDHEVKKVDGVAVVLKDHDERRTTDFIFLLVLIATWVAMTALGAAAGKTGDPNALISPYNDQGKICGHDEIVENEPNLFYVSNTGMGQCVKDCPVVQPLLTSTTESDYVCLSWLQEMLPVGATRPAAFADYIQGSDCFTNGQYKYTSTCGCRMKYVSKPIFKRCVESFKASDPIDPENPTQSDYLRMFMSDIITARNIIFGFGFLIALFSAFLFTYLMSKECIAWFLVWGCVLGVLALGILVISFGQDKLKKWEAEIPQAHTKGQINALKAFNYCFMVLAAIYFLLMLWFRTAINMAIKCVSMASTALNEMPIMVFIPILQIAAFVLFLVPWVYYCLFIASEGESQPIYGPITYGGATKSVMVGRRWVVESNNNIGAKLWFMFFVLLWTMNFIANCGSLVISFSVAKWYFTKPAERAEAIGNTTVYGSYKTVFRFHLGTVAFGSLLIALCQTARSVAMYLQSKTSDECRAKPWFRVVFCCVNCCLCVLECCIKFISKNAYIQTAIYGTPFCESAKNTFSLIANNMLRIGAIMVTSDGALFIGKIFTTVLATGASYVYITQYFKSDLYEPVGPTILVAIISFMTASMFMDVLHMSIDTIFHCFISDESSNGGVAVFAGDDMKGFVDENGKLEQQNGTHCCGVSSSPPAADGASQELANKQ